MTSRSNTDRATRVDRLTAAAQRRSSEAEARARRAIMSLDGRGEPVTFATVAIEAQVSESYLYKHEALASQIRQHAGRHRPRSSRDAEQSATAASLRTKLAVTVDRLRVVEAELAELRDENATLRGEVLDLRRRMRTAR